MPTPFRRAVGRTRITDTRETEMLSFQQYCFETLFDGVLISGVHKKFCRRPKCWNPQPLTAQQATPFAAYLYAGVCASLLSGLFPHPSHHCLLMNPLRCDVLCRCSLDDDLFLLCHHRQQDGYRFWCEKLHSTCVAHGAFCILVDNRTGALVLLWQNWNMSKPGYVT